MSNKLSTNQRTAGGLILAAAGLTLMGYLVYNRYKKSVIDGLVVLKVDSRLLDNVKNEQLITNLFLLSQQAFDNLIKDGKANEQVALTLYSLFKQQKDGNADEFEKNKTQTKPERYAVWLQQADKGEIQCIKEYIILVGQCDAQFNETVKSVASGAIKEINIDTEGSGNPFIKTVPCPAKPDDTEYKNSLKGRDREIFKIYE